MSNKPNETNNLVNEMLDTFASRDTESEKSAMSIKIADALMSNFNDIVVHATFDMLLKSQTPEVQDAIKREVYNTWKHRSTEEITEEINKSENDSGLSSILGIDSKEVANKGFDIADNNIRDYLRIDIQ